MLNNNNGSCNGSKDKDLDRINESCSECRKHFVRFKDIFVSLESDQYICKNCSEELHIEVSECRDID